MIAAMIRCQQTVEEEAVSRLSTIDEFRHLLNLETNLAQDAGQKVNIYHILLSWLHMVRVVVVNKNSDIFGVIMVDF
jgi:hypothetical protein